MLINKVWGLRIFDKPRAFLTNRMPIHIQVEPTTKCNLRCNTCMRSDEVNSDMSLELFKSIIDQLEYPGLLTRSINITGLGEPLLNSQLVSMVKYAKAKGLEVGFTDNFTLMDQNKASNLIKAGVDYINISFDAASKQKFEKIRIGADFEHVMDNIRLFIRTRRELKSHRPKLMLHSTISRKNLGEIQRLIALAEDLEVDGIYLRKHIGVDGISFSKQVSHKKEGDVNYSPIPLETKKLPRSKIKVISLDSSRIPVSCIATKECFITFDGKVLPCGNLMDIVPREEYPKFQFGDLKYDSLGDVWRSSRYKQFRNQITLGEYPSVCKSCILYRHMKKRQ